MRTQHLRIDVGAGDTPAHIAITAFLPAPERLLDPAIVMFAGPGGGYGRGYFDIRFPGYDGYSQAEHHAARGIIVIAYDHLGVGESTVPDLSKLTIEGIAQASDRMVRIVTQRLYEGALVEHYPPIRPSVVIGAGQSVGGCLTIVAQALHQTFDAVAPLGFSAIHTQLPQPTEDAQRKFRERHVARRDADPAAMSVADFASSITDIRFPFHWEDVPPALVDADFAGGYPIRKTSPHWGSLTLPTWAIAMAFEGAVAAEAAMIDTPVFIGCGERDVCPDVHAEPGAYPNCRDVTVFVVPQMAHMHNFASTRQQLWDRLEHWMRGVRSQSERPRHG